jgi:hypothetical protein
MGWISQNKLRNSYDHYLGWGALSRKISQLIKLALCSYITLIKNDGNIIVKGFEKTILGPMF